jgi:hypothetical protein
LDVSVSIGDFRWDEKAGLRRDALSSARAEPVEHSAQTFAMPASSPEPLSSFEVAAPVQVERVSVRLRRNLRRDGARQAVFAQISQCPRLAYLHSSIGGAPLHRARRSQRDFARETLSGRFRALCRGRNRRRQFPSLAETCSRTTEVGWKSCCATPGATLQRRSERRRLAAIRPAARLHQLQAQVPQTGRFFPSFDSSATPGCNTRWLKFFTKRSPNSTRPRSKSEVRWQQASLSPQRGGRSLPLERFRTSTKFSGRGSCRQRE